MHIIKPGFSKEIIKYGICKNCECEFSLEQKEYALYKEATRTLLSNEKAWELNPYSSSTSFSYYNKIDCPCCHKPVELENREILVQQVMPNYIQITEGGYRNECKTNIYDEKSI